MAEFNRKEFLKKLGLTGLAGISAGTILTACGGGGDEGQSATTPEKSPCNDLSGLSEADKKLRTETFKYVDESPKPDQNCENCQFYKPNDFGSACGGCTLFKGPVAPEGWCNSWAAKMG